MPQRLLIFEDGEIRQTDKDITLHDKECMEDGLLRIVEVHDDDGKFYEYLQLEPIAGTFIDNDPVVGSFHNYPPAQPSLGLE